MFHINILTNLMKKTIKSLICPRKHFSVSWCIAKSDDFIESFFFDELFYSVYFFLSVAVFGAEFSCKNIIFKVRLCGHQIHFPFFCKWLCPDIQRCSYQKAFGGSSVNLIDKIYGAFSDKARIVFIKKLQSFGLYFLSCFSF